jgi:hypothetical protein
MAICPICERSFDERAFQLVIRGLGAFDSVACADEAMRRQRRRDRGELATDLLDAARSESALRPRVRQRSAESETG